MILRTQLLNSLQYDAVTQAAEDARARLDSLESFKRQLHDELDFVRGRLVCSSDEIAPEDMTKLDWVSFNNLLEAAVDLYFSPLIDAACRSAVEAESAAAEIEDRVMA